MSELTIGVEIALGLIIAVGAGILIALYLLGKSINKNVEKILTDATTEEQEIIRKKIVKAVFPPRFHTGD